jgi:hypothetical protein
MLRKIKNKLLEAVEECDLFCSHHIALQERQQLQDHYGRRILNDADLCICDGLLSEVLADHES